MSEVEVNEIPKLEELITKKLSTTSNNIDEITDKIFLGDEEGAKELDFFKNENIKNILSITDSPPQYPEDLNINHKSINLDEQLSSNIFENLKEGIEFIENSDKIYIHCSCGICRSPAFVIAYLMWKTHSNFKQVYSFVQKRRSCVELNMKYIIQLQKFGNILKNNNYNIERINFNSIYIK